MIANTDLSKTNQRLVNNALNGIPISDDTEALIKTRFANYLVRLESWQAQVTELKVTDISQTDKMQDAREGRLALRDIRIGAEKLKDELKANALAEGKAIQSVYNLIRDTVKPLEAYLKDQEQFAERIEAERIAALTDERLEKLGSLARFLDQSQLEALGSLEDRGFKLLMAGAKMSAQEEEEAQRKREEEEQAAAREKERLEKENERLVKASQALLAEAEKQAAAREAAEDERRAALQELEEARQKRVKEEAAARAAQEDEEAARNMAELRARLASDKKKAEDFVAGVINTLQEASVIFENEKNQKVFDLGINAVVGMLNQIADQIN